MYLPAERGYMHRAVLKRLRENRRVDPDHVRASLPCDYLRLLPLKDACLSPSLLPSHFTNKSNSLGRRGLCRCDATSGEWSVGVECVPAKCPPPTLPANAVASCAGTRSSTCTPTCKAGWGSRTAYPAVPCSDRGVWGDFNTFTCVRDCGSPDNLLPHSEVAGTCTSQLSGATCTVQCSSGYERIGGSTQIT